MKKNIVRLALAGILSLNLAGMALAQQPVATADKDTVNADKAAKPVFYEATEDQESESKGSNNAIYFAVGLAVVAGAVYFLRKKKK
jgi:LPXTG-motif cell wall-anchored protein